MEFKRPQKLLVHCESPLLPTGFGNMGREILTRLYNVKTDWGTPKFEIAVMALGQGVDPFNPNQNPFPFKMFPHLGDRNANPFGQDYAAEIVKRFNPDIVLSIGDVWMVDFWNDHGRIPQELRKTFKLVGYVAIDGYPVPDFWVDKFRHFDKIITFTKFGKAGIDERAKELGIALDCSYIYHGVNTQTFRPLPQSDIDNFKASRGLTGKKIIGMFSRNQPRKHHPEFIEFAYKFLEKHNNDPNILFYLHCIERDAGWDLPALIRDIDKLRLRERLIKYGSAKPGQEIPEQTVKLEGRFFFPGLPSPAAGLHPDLLNMMYNICDAHVMLTSGEGFGMCISESLSAGVPSFTNDYAASAELVTDSGGGEVIKSRDFTYRGSDHNFFRPHTDYDDAVEKVTKVINDPELRKKYGKKGRAFSLANSWDIVVLDWTKELSSLYDIPEKIYQRAEVI